MLNIITKEVPIEDELKEKIEFTCKYLNIKCIIKNECIHSFDKTNQKFEKQHLDDKRADEFLKSLIETKHIDLVEQLVKGANYNDECTSKVYK